MSEDYPLKEYTSEERAELFPGLEEAEEKGLIPKNWDDRRPLTDKFMPEVWKEIHKLVAPYRIDMTDTGHPPQWLGGIGRFSGLPGDVLRQIVHLLPVLEEQTQNSSPTIGEMIKMETLLGVQKDESLTFYGFIGEPGVREDFSLEGYTFATKDPLRMLWFRHRYGDSEGTQLDQDEETHLFVCQTWWD